MSKNTLVSVVIPTRNAGPGFEQILQATLAQNVTGKQIEIVVVDSDSTDGTLALAERYGAKVISISPDEFNHGETRNLGIQSSRGDLVACLVQDAQPVNAEWLPALVTAVESRPEVAGAYSRQVPWPGDDALTRFVVHQWHQVQGGQRVVQALPASGGLASLTFPERRRMCTFDDVSSMLRRDVWERFPYRPVRFAEDMDWAKRVLQADYRIVYEPRSQVYHSHTRPFSYNLRRQYVDEYIVMDLLEADEGTLRGWNGPRQASGLILRVLAQARAQRTLSPGLVLRTVSFALATTLGSMARCVIHPRLRGGSGPGWARRMNDWLMAGI
jgi:rhamnosyltransferase